HRRRIPFAILALSLASTVLAQAPPSASGGQPPAPGAQPTPGRGGGRGPQGPQVVSPEVTPDHHIVFRILAPQATTVGLRGGDIPGLGQGPQFQKAENGVWEATIGPIDPGAYRYTF